MGAIAHMTVTLVVLRDTLGVCGQRTSNCAWVPPSQAPSHVGMSLLHFLGDRRCLCALVSPSLAPLRVCFCTNYQYNNLPGFRLQRWVGGHVCFFLHTSSCNCPRKPFAVTRRSRRALHSEGAPHARAGFVQSLSAALGSGLLQAPLFRFFSFFLIFTVVIQKVWRALAQSVALSATLCIFAHAPLVPANFHICCPPAGLGVRLFRGTGAGLRRPLMCGLSRPPWVVASTFRSGGSG